MLFLNPDPDGRLGHSFIDFYLHQKCPGIFFARPDLLNRVIPQYGTVDISHRNFPADFYPFPPNLVRQGYQRVLGIISIIDHRYRKSRTNGDAAGAARTGIQVDHIGQPGDFILFGFDGPYRAHRCARIAGHFLVAVKYRKYAVFLGRWIAPLFPTGLGFQDGGLFVPFLRNFAHIEAEGSGNLKTFNLAGKHGGRSFGDFLGIAGAKYIHAPLFGL